MQKQEVNDLNTKQKHILDCALMLLVDVGSEGLTMRKLAERSGMRLSNVQYYFKSRDDVLKAMVSHYFEQCTDRVIRLASQNAGNTTRDRLHHIVEEGLSHGAEISDMCKTFRELWAISSRNEDIHDHLMEYYRGFANVVVANIFGDNIDPANKQRVSALLIPFFEGYSVTAPAMEMDASAVVHMITDFALQMAQDTAPA